MPELSQEMYYGPNVQNLVESDDCKVMRLSDNSGEGNDDTFIMFFPVCFSCIMIST